MVHPDTFPRQSSSQEHLLLMYVYTLLLIGTRPVIDVSKVAEGDLYSRYSMTGELEYAIYHGQWKPVPNNTWVEVTHTILPTELKGAWVWNQRGSGLWYNTGNTLVFPTPANMDKIHAEAIQFLSDDCSVNISNNWPQLESDVFGQCAREKGYDSIQFEPQTGQIPLGTFNLTGLTEMVLVNIDGDKGCGVINISETPLKSGWLASQQCTCINKPIAPSCGLMPKPPFPLNIFGEEPRLCELREESLKNSCNSLTCDSMQCIF